MSFITTDLINAALVNIGSNTTKENNMKDSVTVAELAEMVAEHNAGKGTSKKKVMPKYEKLNSVYISTTYNGYVVEVMYSGNGYARELQKNWSFQSMAELLKRLPEILEQPVEKRAVVAKGK